jgi:type II secretory pathway component PulM
MKEETNQNNLSEFETTDDDGRGREKQKIRIKYRQRVNIKKRPRGFKLAKYWKKSRKNLVAYFILFLLLVATFFMVAQVAKQQLEMNQHQTRKQLGK